MCFCCMFNPPSRRGQHARTSDAGPPFLGTATLKCPPTWCVERAHVYTLRSWISDLILWCTATEIPANRQAAIAALQVTGSARELVRELPPEVLRDGHVDPQTGQQLTGLMVLVQHLARRYAPMEQETSTKAISELLNFCRMQGETIDELLVRFDILRNRAIVRGGLGINVQGLSWMLLRAMQIGPEEWDKFLHFNGGQLPHDQATMNQLVERLRRFGHLQEGAMKHGTRQGGTGDPGNYFSPVFTEHPGPSACAGGGMPSAASPMPHAQAPHFGANAWSSGSSQAFVSQAGAGSPEASYIAHEDGHMQCPHCHSYFDEEFSSGTDSDSDSELDGMYQSVQVDGETRTDETAVMNQVYQEYVMAKRKWRRMTGTGSSITSSGAMFLISSGLPFATPLRHFCRQMLSRRERVIARGPIKVVTIGVRTPGVETASLCDACVAELMSTSSNDARKLSLTKRAVTAKLSTPLRFQRSPTHQLLALPPLILAGKVQVRFTRYLLPSPSSITI